MVCIYVHNEAFQNKGSTLLTKCYPHQLTLIIITAAWFIIVICQNYCNLSTLLCNVGIHLIHPRSTQKKQGEGTIYTSCAHFGSVFFLQQNHQNKKKDTTKMCLNGNGNIKIKTRKKWRKESEMVSQKSGQIISLGLKAVKVEYSAHQTWFLHFYFTLGYSESWFIC